MSVRDPAASTVDHSGLELPAVAVDIPLPSAGRRGRIALGGLLVSGLLVVLCAAHTASFLPESIRPAPAALAGVFGGLGLDLHVVGAIALLIVMFVSYAVAVTRSAEFSLRAVLATVAVLDLLVLLGPPLISTDVFSYQAYARMGAEYGINPYLNGPHAIALDPIFYYVGADWSYIPSAYGPVFTVFSYALAHLSIASSVLAYKAIAVVASLGIVALVARCARQRQTDPVRAVALVGLNPLFVIYGVGGGHNDLLMLLAMMGATWAFLARRRSTSGALTLLAVSVKLTAGLMLPFALAAEGSALRDGSVDPVARRRRLAYLGGAVAGFVVLALLSVVVFGGDSVLHLLATVHQSQDEGDWKSIPGAIGTRLGMPTVGRIVGYLLAAGFVALACWLLRQVWRGRMDWIDGLAWATLVLLIASSSLLPWYIAWLLPFAALATSSRLRTSTVALTGIVLGIQLLGYIPHG